MGEGTVGGPGVETTTTGTTADVEAARLRDRRERHRPNTKIVCRRLPPNMTEESFLDQVSPIPEHDYFYYAKPDISLAPNLFCRAYINFVNVDDIYNFRDKFDEYIFLDDKGNEYPAIVEYAPFQRIIKKRRKKDVKCGTLESDPAYLEFLDSLKETDSDSREPKMEYSYQPTEEKKETVTPLLEFLAARKRDERRRREEKQRRRPRNRMSKDDDNDDFKQSKYKDDDEKDDDASPINNEGVEIKETQFQSKGRIRTYKENRRSNEDHHKRSEYNKKGKAPFKDNDGDGNDDEKINRKEKRDRQRETYRNKEKDKFYDVKKEKFKSDKKPVKVSVYRELDEKEQDKLAGSSTKPAGSITPGKSGEKSPNTGKGPPISSKIKPFTQLPQYKPSDLPKVIDEMDANRQKSEIDSVAKIVKDKKNSDTSDVKPIKVVNKQKDENKSTKETKSDSSHDSNTRRNSLESKQKKSSIPDEAVLRRNKSLDEKSQDSNTGDERKSRENDPRTERRIRNKDRPSLVIYQPGMGRFSKQRIERGKDAPKNSDTSGKAENSSASSSNSVNSQDLIAEE